MSSIMTIDEAIQDYLETIESQEKFIESCNYQIDNGNLDEEFGLIQISDCNQCAEEFRQLVQWLIDYKRLLKAKEKIKDLINSSNRGSCDYFIVDQIEEVLNNVSEDDR